MEEDTRNFHINIVHRNSILAIYGIIATFLSLNIVLAFFALISPLFTGIFDPIQLAWLLNIAFNLLLLYIIREPLITAFSSPLELCIDQYSFDIIYRNNSIKIPCEALKYIKLLPYRRVTSIYHRRTKIYLTYNREESAESVIILDGDMIPEYREIINLLLSKNPSIIIHEHQNEQLFP